MWNSDLEDVSYEETIEICTAAAECYLYCGQYDEASRLLSAVSENAKTELDKATSCILQSRGFTQQGNATKAYEKLTQCLSFLGVEVGDDPTFPACDAEFKRLSQQILGLDKDTLIGKPVADEESNLALVGAVLVEATATAFWYVP